MINKYEEMDKEGRAIVISMFSHKLTMVEGDASDRFDLSGSTLSGNWFMEVKYRPDLASTHYTSDIMEYKKLAALRNIDKDATHYYTMIFSDGIARCYNLKDVSIFDCHFDNILCPVSKVEDKGLINKLVIELPVSKAKIHKWKK